MSIEKIKESLGDFARDIRLNIENVLTPEGSPGLSQEQIWGVALASSYGTKDSELTHLLRTAGGDLISHERNEAAKIAATLMAMNNVYYRFLHLAENPEFSQMPARLRMNAMSRPGVDKVEFELMSLAVSAIEGCGKCITAHVNELKKHAITNEGIQSSIRIAAVINATYQARAIMT